MNEKTAEIRRALNQHRNTEWERKLLKLNPKDNSLWKMTKILKKQYKPIPTLIKNRIEAITDKEKAEILATQFEKIHDIHSIVNNEEQNDIIKTVQNYLTKERRRLVPTRHNTQGSRTNY